MLPLRLLALQRGRTPAELYGKPTSPLTSEFDILKKILFIVLCDKMAQTNHAKVHNTATGMQKATLLEETTTEIKTKIKKKTSYTTQYVQHINDFKSCILMQDHCLRFRKYMCAKRLIG